MSEILRLENLNYSYIDGGYERSILKDLSYSFESGKFYTILGPSGSGKTTLLSIIAGLDTAKSGKIYFNGEDVDKIGLYKYRRNKIAVVFQQYNLISYMTALENVMLAMMERNFINIQLLMKHLEKDLSTLIENNLLIQPSTL